MQTSDPPPPSPFLHEWPFLPFVWQLAALCSLVSDSNAGGGCEGR